MCRVYYCEQCKGDVFRLDSVAMIPNRCERCGNGFTYAKDEDPEVIAAHIGVPVSEWIDLTTDVHTTESATAV
jgi:hypothetical protein